MGREWMMPSFLPLFLKRGTLINYALHRAFPQFALPRSFPRSYFGDPCVSPARLFLSKWDLLKSCQTLHHLSTLQTVLRKDPCQTLKRRSELSRAASPLRGNLLDVQAARLVVQSHRTSSTMALMCQLIVRVFSAQILIDCLLIHCSIPHTCPRCGWSIHSFANSPSLVMRLSCLPPERTRLMSTLIPVSCDQWCLLQISTTGLN